MPTKIGYPFLLLALHVVSSAFGTIELSPYRYHDDGKLIVQYESSGADWKVRAQLPKKGPDSFCMRLSQGHYLNVPACLGAHTASLRGQSEKVQSIVTQLKALQDRIGTVVTEGAKQRIRAEVERVTVTLQSETRRLEEMTARRVILEELEVDLLPAPEVYTYFADKDPEHVRAIRQWAALFQSDADKRRDADYEARNREQARIAQENADRARSQQQAQEQSNRRAAYLSCLNSVRSQEESCKAGCKSTYDSVSSKPNRTFAEGTRFGIEYGNCLRGCSNTYDIYTRCRE